MAYYFHPTFGPHEGDPIGGAESSALPEPEYLQIVEAKRAMEQSEADAKRQAELASTPIQEFFAAKMKAINEGKNQALDAGFMHDGARFDSDYKARLAYLEAATQFQIDPGFSTHWKASTGQWVTMDAALFAALIPVYRGHIQACFAWQAAMEQELATAYAAGDRAAMAAIPESMD